MVRIEKVSLDSIAYNSGIVAGDVLISINGHKICDVIDYQFYLADTDLLIRLKREDKSVKIS